MSKSFTTPLICALITALLVSACAPRNQDPTQTQAAHQALSTQEDLLILDVRTAAEFAMGHLDGASHLPVSQLEERLKELPEDRGTPILVYCRSGGRSAQAKTILEAHGYTHVTDGGALESLRTPPK